MSKQIIINEIHRQARKNFKRCHVILKGIDDLWQADLIDMQMFKKNNKGYTFILIVIDSFSKFAWAIPVKNKTKNEISNAFDKLLSKGRRPKHLQTDLGTEFYNERFEKLMKKYQINHYSTYSVKKACIVERLIRTLKNKLYKYFHLVGNYKWVGKLLNNTTDEYNHTMHRIIKFRPSEVNTSNETKVLQNILSSQKVSSCGNAKFKVGDQVRISKYKGLFEKGFTPNWSTELFTIFKVNDTKPITYHVQDQQKQNILGTFYEQELLKTQVPGVYLVEKVLRKNGKKLFVKWLGLKDSENSWIDKNDVV